MVTQAKKPAYQRPYKSRSERREVARHKYDENKDNKFLWRVAVAVGFVVLLALGFALKGLMDREGNGPASHSSAQGIM